MQKIVNLHSLLGQDEVFREGKLYYKGFQIFSSPQVHTDAIKLIEKYLRPFDKVLELGAGAGAFTLRLQEKGFQVFASGIEPETFTLSKVPYFYLDLNHELPKKHIGRYEAVVAIEVIEHLENIYDFFRKIYQVLKPQGWAFISTPNIMDMRNRLMFFHSGNFFKVNPHVFKTWGHIQVLPFWLLRLAAEKAGLVWWEALGIGNFREDLIPKWQKILTSTALFLKKIFYKEQFPREFSNPNLLMVLKKEN